MAFGHHGVAIQVLDAFNAQPLDDWRPMDALTNMRIESSREDHEPMAVVHVDGQLYSVIFDTGTGASGQSAVLVRPTRYQKILESIEEQFHAAMAEHRDTITTQLYDALVQHNINPTAFLLIFPRPRVCVHEYGAKRYRARTLRGILDQIGTSTGHLSTRIQQFMPTLLRNLRNVKFGSVQKRLETPNLVVPNSWRQ